MKKNVVCIEIVGKEKIKVKIKEYPEIRAKRRFLKKALILSKSKFPGIIKKISIEVILSGLIKYRIFVISKKSKDEVVSILERWIRLLKIKRAVYVFFELLFMPLSGFLAILPGPNVFFYTLFLLFYFHLRTFLSLRKIRIKELDLEVRDEAC